MRTSYAMNPDVAVEGMAHGGDLNESIPLQLVQRKQVLRLTVTAGAETDDLVITLEDDETGQSYTATATGNANEATLGANALAAVRASEIDKVFSVAAITASSGSDLVIDFTARHGNRSYSGSATGGTSSATAPAFTETVEPGGAGLEFGRMVAYGSTAGSFEQVSATTALGDLAGMLERTEANHFRPEGETLATLDLCPVGKEMPIKRRRRIWVKVEEAVAVGDPVYMRRALTSSAGRLGGFRMSPAGSTQVATLTPAENALSYGVKYGYGGRTYVATYNPTDGTTSVADACAGIEDALDENAPAGVTVSVGGTTEVTLTAAAGTEFDYVENIAWSLDAEAASMTVSVAAADVDAIDISTIARWTKPAAADGLALLTIDMRAA